MSRDAFETCPVCHEKSDQCLSCASYVVNGERIYYGKLINFGASNDSELRFIQRIQKQRTIAFFHNGELYIPSRQGRSVPLAIGLQWDTWQEQQKRIDELDQRATGLALDQMETAKLNAELQKRIDTVIAILPSIKAENNLWGCEQIERQIELLEQALKGGDE